MSSKLERLSQILQDAFGSRVVNLVLDRGELTLEVRSSDYLAVAQTLRDDPAMRFEQLIDLSGVDYSAYGNGGRTGLRFASVAHLTSIAHNWRLRLRTFAEDDGFPVVDSVWSVWPSANWYERESFDLYGIVYRDHPDLRRILTDYGFVGYPFRKDFPVSGYVEMRYDAEQGRVVYQPVSIEPREITPRIVREENYGDVGHG